MQHENLTKKDQQITNILSIDIEEWYQTIFFNNGMNNYAITDLPGDVEIILLLLEKYNTKATFFVLGSVAEKYPRLVKRIEQKSHEIASHGYLHRSVNKMSKQEFVADVKHSLAILRSLADAEILGYRAPNWSIDKNTYWALEELRSFGLRYDSSMYPIRIDILKVRNKERFPYKIADDFIEFPPSRFRFLGCDLPFSGGFFLRIFSLNFISRKIMEINQKGLPAMVSLHSWEFAKSVPIVKIGRWKYKFQCINTNSLVHKLETLLKNFKFSAIREVL